MQCEPISEDRYHTVLIDFENYRQAIDSKNHLANKTECDDLKNEEYQMCGKACVLNCRSDSTATKFIVSNEKCDLNKCVEGCFCKAGFVRYQAKCVPIAECPKKTRRNKAMNFDAEPNADAQIKIQNENKVPSQVQENLGDPISLYGFFNQPMAMNIQQVDGSGNIQKTDADHHEQAQDSKQPSNKLTTGNSSSKKNAHKNPSSNRYFNGDRVGGLFHEGK